MKFIIWMLILFWCPIFVLNLCALRTIQDWIFSIKSSYMFMLLPGALFLFILTAKAVDNYRRRHPVLFGLAAFAAAAYGAYTTLLSGDPIDPLRSYIRPQPRAGPCSRRGIAIHSLRNRRTDESGAGVRGTATYRSEGTENSGCGA